MIINFNNGFVHIFLFKSSCTTLELTACSLNENKWNTKKSMIVCIVCNAVCQRAPVRLKQCLTVKKIKPVALAAVELHCTVMKALAS